MLVKIDGYITSDWGDTRHKLEYQFSKMDTEKGSLIFSSCEDLSASELHDFLFERAQLYNTVSKRRNVKNIAKCFIISMPSGEYPSEETYVRVGERLLDKLGYSDCPHVMFQHNDTDKSHVHIIVSTITDDLTHVDNADDYQKCYGVARVLEKEFGFSELKKTTFQKQSFQEIASRRYYFQNALQKAIRQDKTGELSKLFDPEMRQRILRQSLTNDQMLELLGEETYNRVGEELQAGKFFHKYYKRELIERLEGVYRISEGKDFLKAAKESGIYVRHVKDTLIYGISDLSFYVNENSVPRKFHYKALKGNRTTFKLDSEQKQYIFESFCNSCYGTSEAFLNRLNDHQILARDPVGKYLFITKNMNGKFGDYSFIDATAPDPQWVKGKDLSQKLSGMELKDILDNHYAHEYKLSEDFQPPEQAQNDMFSKALRNALKNHAVQERLYQLIPNDVLDYIKQYQMKKNQFRILMSESSFDAVNDILYKGGFFHSYYLESLKKELDTIFDLSGGDRSQFLLLAEKKGIHIRLLKNQTFLYEIKDSEGTYRFKENRLPKKFRNAQLVAKQPTQIYKLQEEQFRHVFDSSRNSMKEATTLKDFFTRLAHQQVYVFDQSMQPVNEKNGSEILFGQCIFVDQSCINPVSIPGQSLSPKISHRRMGDLLSGKMSVDYIPIYFPNNYHPAVYGFSSFHARGTPEEDFIKRKKKKRGIGDIDIHSST